MSGGPGACPPAYVALRPVRSRDGGRELAPYIKGMRDGRLISCVPYTNWPPLCCHSLGVVRSRGAATTAAAAREAAAAEAAAAAAAEPDGADDGAADGGEGRKGGGGGGAAHASRSAALTHNRRRALVHLVLPKHVSCAWFVGFIDP